MFVISPDLLIGFSLHFHVYWGIFLLSNSKHFCCVLKNDAILAPTTPSHDVLAMSSTENVSTHDVRTTGKNLKDACYVLFCAKTSC